MLKTVSAITNAIGALNYKGTWNASTNSPALASGVGTKGDYYVVSVAGTTTLDGISTWYVGDWAAFNGSVWQRLEGGVDDPALSVKSNSTTGLMQITGPAAGQTRVMTIPDANFTAARTDAAQTLTGNQTITNGNVVLSSGYGIDFSANPAAPGMVSELFDDYERGTFTPVVADAETGGNVAASASVDGLYTKVGNVVTVTFFAASINTTGMTAGNNLWIRGLPFANNATAPANGVVDMRNTAFTVYPTVFCGQSSSAVRLFEHSSGAGVTPIPVSAVNAGSAFFMSLTYTV